MLLNPNYAYDDGPLYMEIVSETQEDHLKGEIFLDGCHGERFALFKVATDGETPIFVHPLNATCGVALDAEGYPLIEGYTRTSTES